MIHKSNINSSVLPSLREGSGGGCLPFLREGLGGGLDIVLLADGDYPSHAIPLEVLQGTDRLYCCDHAGRVAIDHGLHPAAIVGDGDSLTAEQKAAYGALYHQVDEQDYNDLTKTLRFALSQWQAEHPTEGRQAENHQAENRAMEEEPTETTRLRVAILGATGKREDHTLGNISLIMWYYRNFPVMPIMLTDYGFFTPATGKTTFPSFLGQQVSIYNFGCTRLMSEQLKWDSYPYAELWQGGLNEALSDSFTLHGDADYMVFQTYCGKKRA